MIPTGVLDVGQNAGIPTGVLDVGQNAGHQVRVKEDGHGGCDGALGGWHGGMGGGMAPTPAGAAAAGLIMTPPPPSSPRRHRRRRCHPRCRPCIQGPLSALEVTRFSSLGGGESATAGAGPILYAVAGSAAGSLSAIDGNTLCVKTFG